MCETDADKAAWSFCMGLVFESLGQTEFMIESYYEASIYAPDFYLPYLKVARELYNDSMLETVEENYREAIRCLEKAEIDEFWKFEIVH